MDESECLHYFMFWNSSWQVERGWQLKTRIRVRICSNQYMLQLVSDWENMLFTLNLSSWYLFDKHHFYWAHMFARGDTSKSVHFRPLHVQDAHNDRNISISVHTIAPERKILHLSSWLLLILKLQRGTKKIPFNYWKGTLFLRFLSCSSFVDVVSFF
jgi:hypothetical protein